MPRPVHCIKDGELSVETQQQYEGRRVALTSEDIVFSYAEGEIVLDVIPNHKIVEVAPVRLTDLLDDQSQEIPMHSSVGVYIHTSEGTRSQHSGSVRRRAIHSDLFENKRKVHGFRIVTELAQDDFHDFDSQGVGKTYTLVADSEEECEEWVQVGSH